MLVGAHGKLNRCFATELWNYDLALWVWERKRGFCTLEKETMLFRVGKYVGVACAGKARGRWAST